MKTILLMIGLAGAVSTQAADFNFYASPNKLYSCTGYSTGACQGFETGDPAHVVQSVSLIVSNRNPLTFKVALWIDGTPYDAYDVLASDAGKPFVAWDNTGSGDTISVTVTFAATRHCVGKATHCTDRYLPNAGTVSIP